MNWRGVRLSSEAVLHAHGRMRAPEPALSLLPTHCSQIATKDLN